MSCPTIRRFVCLLLAVCVSYRLFLVANTGRAKASGTGKLA